MPLYTSQTAGVGTHGLLTSDIGALVVEPIRAASVALSISTVVQTNENQFRIPRLSADAGVAWVSEGSEITPDDAELSELVLTPLKVAGLSIISSELADDSNPAAQQIVGQSLAASIAREIDRTFFDDTTVDGPSGIGSITATEVDTNGSITNLDPFAEALSAAEQVGAELTAFVANPADVLTLSKIKKLTGSTEPLLNVDATQATRRQILGVPLISSPAVASGHIWGVPRAKVFVVLRSDVKVDVDRSYAFNKDAVAVRVSARVAFGFPHEASVVHLFNAGS